MKFLRLSLITMVALASIASAEARSDTGVTEQNRALIKAFAHRFYEQHDVRGAFERYVAPDYVQHNPGIADGREAAIKALEPMFSAPGSVFDIKKVLVDGDLAVIHLHGRAGDHGAGGSVADFYRIEHGKIVEHWDVLQPIEPTSVNPHPYF